MLILAAITVICAAASLVLFLRRDLMMFQQNSYYPSRYKQWMAQDGDSTSLRRLVGWIVFFGSLVPAISPRASMPVILAYSLVTAWDLWSKKYKKPLVVTNRVKRLLGVSLGVVAVAWAIGYLALGSLPVFPSVLYVGARVMVLAMCASSAVVLFANWLLKPVEASINRKYYREAASILKSMPNLTVVGITGSYGKTSTKHYLTRILQEKYDVLMTPGNFNTTLGVIRTIREYMKPYNEVFVCEMGAKQPGDIKEICDLVHPQIGIITAVGPMHLESFKSIENVQRTKFDLADSLPADGLAVVNDDFEYIANRPVENAECVRYSVSPDHKADYRATRIAYSPTGTSFAIEDASGREVIELETRLVGSCNVSNLVAAVIVALRLGVEPEKIRYAVSKIEQVEHRLSMKHVPGGINIIDDAYNSNPVGSAMALEVLASMTGGKRIVITPGMVELGDDQEELNFKLGQQIAHSVDLAIIVGEYNRQAITEGIEKEGVLLPNQVKAVDTFAEAQQLLMAIAQPGDTVLYENDLPDTFK